MPPWVWNSLPEVRVVLEPTFQVPQVEAPKSTTPFSPKPVTVGTPYDTASCGSSVIVRVAERPSALTVHFNGSSPSSTVSPSVLNTYRFTTPGTVRSTSRVTLPLSK